MNKKAPQMPAAPKPMKSAPRDGTIVLIKARGLGWVRAYYMDCGWLRDGGDEDVPLLEFAVGQAVVAVAEGEHSQALHPCLQWILLAWLAIGLGHCGHGFSVGRWDLAATSNATAGESSRPSLGRGGRVAHAAGNTRLPQVGSCR